MESALWVADQSPPFSHNRRFKHVPLVTVQWFLLQHCCRAAQLPTNFIAASASSRCDSEPFKCPWRSEGLRGASSCILHLTMSCLQWDSLMTWKEVDFFIYYFLFTKHSRQLEVDTSVKSLSLQNSLRWILWIIDEWYWYNFSLNVPATKEKLFTFFSFLFFLWSCSSRMVDYGRLLWSCSCQISSGWEKTNK